MTTGASYSAATMGSTSTTSTFDVNHPYYLHPSDNPGMQLITVVLDGSNYNQWNRSMDIALSSKLKLGFVDGTYVQPATGSSLHVHWTRCNNMVTSWLLNSVSVDIRNSVVYMKSARAIWLDLETRYSQTNVPKLFNLRTEISHLTQGNLSISAYFTKFRSVHDELECIVSKPRCTCNSCTCSVNVKLDAQDQDVQLSQFLMGLNEQYTAIRGQILLMKPLPSISQCYSLLLQEENQRSMSGSAVSSDSMAMSVKQSSKFQGYKAKRASGDSLQCDYCHMTGHTKDTCFCIHGFPSWHKLFGKPKPKPRLQPSIPNFRPGGSVAQVSSQFDGGDKTVSNASMNFSENQCKMLIDMLQKSMASSGNNAPTGSSGHNGLTSGSTPQPSASPWYPAANSSQFTGSQFSGPYLDEGPRDW